MKAKRRRHEAAFKARVRWKRCEGSRRYNKSPRSMICTLCRCHITIGLSLYLLAAVIHLGSRAHVYLDVGDSQRFHRGEAKGDYGGNRHWWSYYAGSDVCRTDLWCIHESCAFAGSGDLQRTPGVSVGLPRSTHPRCAPGHTRLLRRAGGGLLLCAFDLSRRL